MKSFRQQKNATLPPQEKHDAREAMTLAAGSGFTLAELVQMGLAHVRPPVIAATVESARLAFLRSRLAEKVRPSTYSWYESKLRFLDQFNARNLDDITRENLEGAATAMEVGESTRRAFYRAARALWRWSMVQPKPMASRDPTAGLKVTPSRRDVQNDPPVPVDTVAAIFKQLPARLRPGAALLFFAGVRPQELWGSGKEPMTWLNVNTEERIVTVPANLSKTRRPRNLEDLPETLWHWIGKPGKDDEPVCPAQSQQLIRQIQQAGGYWAFKDKGRERKRKTVKEWPHDATRHTFASYAAAFTADPGKVATWMGHEGNPTMLFRHYRAGGTRKADAVKYWALRP
jgi:hypothetical protein